MNSIITAVILVVFGPHCPDFTTRGREWGSKHNCRFWFFHYSETPPPPKYDNEHRKLLYYFVDHYFACSWISSLECHSFLFVRLLTFPFCIYMFIHLVPYWFIRTFGHPFWGFLITHTHIQTHGRTPLDEWSAHCRDLYLHRTTQQTNIHALSGIQTRGPSNQVAADVCLRPHGHWDQLMPYSTCKLTWVSCYCFISCKVENNLFLF
jgi:hypothetical protein